MCELIEEEATEEEERRRRQRVQSQKQKPYTVMWGKTYVNAHAHASASQIWLQNIGGQESDCLMADCIFGSKSDPIFGPKSGPQSRIQKLDCIFISSFGSLLGPRFWVQIWTQKWGQIYAQKRDQPLDNSRCFATRFAAH